MKKFTYIALYLMAITSLINAWTIKIHNDTDNALQVFVYLESTAGQVRTTFFSALTVGAVGIGEGVSIEKYLDKLKKNKNKEFIKNLSDDSHSRNTKNFILSAHTTKKFDVGSGCIRAVKAWIVEDQKYNPILGDKYSWTTKVVHGNENQCASHDFTVRVKKYDDGTKRLKIDMK
jgi:hypothetical protein